MWFAVFAEGAGMVGNVMKIYSRFLPPADTRGSFDAEAAPKSAQSGGVAARPFHVGSHLGN